MITIIQPIIINKDVEETPGGVLYAKSGKSEILTLDPQVLADEIQSLSEIVEKIPVRENAGISMSEIEINVAITTKGKLAIFGSGLEAGASAGLKIKFIKEKPNQDNPANAKKRSTD